MKYVKFGTMAALASVAFVACSSEQDSANMSGDSSVSMKLVTPEGILITAVSYDLDTQAGADVKSGVIEVPFPDSVADGFIGALPLEDYSLTVSATATYQGETISCESDAPTLFSLTVPNSTTPIGDVNLTCTIQVPVGNETANVTFTVDVELEEIPVVVNALETFTVAPTTAAAALVGDVCDWAPIGIDVSNGNPEIVYSWTASPDGTFALNPANTVGSYECASEGAKTLTVTATYQGASASINVPVTCNACAGEPPPCGDGIVGPGEECDSSEPWCVACQIDPICGDGVLHEVGTCDACDEECDDSNLADGDGCSSTCTDEGLICEPTETECSGVCVDTETDEANCGACAAPCDAGETCNAGACEGGTPTFPQLPSAECVACYEALPDVGPFNAEFCEGDPLCEAVRDCALTLQTEAAGTCFSPTAGDCYCGIGQGSGDACEQAAFVPAGPCADAIKAGNPAGWDNLTTLQQYFSFDTSSGVAMNIVSFTQLDPTCQATCSLSDP